MFGELIGKGEFSKVYRAKCRGQEVAVKVFEGAKNEEKELEIIRVEIKIMTFHFSLNSVIFHLNSFFKVKSSIQTLFSSWWATISNNFERHNFLPFFSSKGACTDPMKELMFGKTQTTLFETENFQFSPSL